MRSIREVLECGSSGVRKLFEYKQNTPVSDDTKGMREERGIALVMTMGILSMLLVLALAFAASARTERKAASAGADVVQARLLAESAVHRIAALAQNYHDIASRTEATTHGTWGFYNASNNDTRDFIYRLATNDYYGTELLGWSKANTILTANSAITYGKINWEYIIMPVPVNGVNANQIVGRIAYTMIPESGIDPAALVENGANENVVNMEKRFGIHMHEINIASLNDSANTNKLFPDGYVSGYVEKFNYNTGFGGTFDTTAWTGPRPQGIGWPDFTTMFSATRLNVANTDHQMAMKSWFVENPVATDEKFWIDINNDGVQDSNEFHHRFNLARTDWNNLGTLGANSAAAVGIILGTSTPTGAGGAGPWVWTLDSLAADGTADNMCDGASIPWLGLANWTDAGTFPDAATRAKQIAANLIDYCDNEVDAGGNPIPIPTSDVAANTWSDASRPTYTGNEKTFYINEAHLLFSCDQEAMPLNDVTGNFLWNSYAASAQLTVEIVDIYNPAVPLPVPNIYASGQLSFKWRRADNSLQTESVTFTDQAVSASVTTVAGFSSASYNIGAWNRGTNAEKVKTDVPPKPPEIIDLSWHITSIIIKDGAGNGVDYARPYAAAGAATTVGSLGTGNDTFYVQVSNQIEDPRQNLNPADWPAPVVQLDSGGAPALIYTLRTNNVGANPKIDGAGLDLEDSTDVLNISTAFIANRPMKSPWELGLIHRGAKWETINLKEYNAVEKASLTAGGGAYKNDGSAYNGGDANILDQIKMTRDTQSPMKVSYSVAAANDILYALLDKIKIGSDIKSGVADNIALTGTPITGAGVAKVVGGILNSSADFITRASVANSLTTGNEWALSGGTTVCGVLQDTDAKQEELIGKFINLTTMESTTETSQSDFFNAIVLAQTIKDVGRDGTDITILKDLNNDGQIQGSATVDESTLGYDVDGLHGENSSGFLGGSGEYNDFSAFASGSFSVNEQIGAQLGRYDRYADEITAEQKLKVQLYRHPGTSPTPGKVEIISIEYLD